MAALHLSFINIQTKSSTWQCRLGSCSKGITVLTKHDILWIGEMRWNKRASLNQIIKVAHLETGVELVAWEGTEFEIVYQYRFPNSLLEMVIVKFFSMKSSCSAKILVVECLHHVDCHFLIVGQWHDTVSLHKHAPEIVHNYNSWRLSTTAW